MSYFGFKNDSRSSLVALHQTKKTVVTTPHMVEQLERGRRLGWWESYGPFRSREGEMGSTWTISNVKFSSAITTSSMSSTSSTWLTLTPASYTKLWCFYKKCIATIWPFHGSAISKIGKFQSFCSGPSSYCSMVYFAWYKDSNLLQQTWYGQREEEVLVFCRVAKFWTK